jgi:hypothetical protein
LPFLRFNRDKRGYETTALLHSFRRQGRARARILYWFRSPIDVKVGRSPIDEDAIRLIEEHHRDLSFDWSKILESRGLGRPESSPAPQDRAPSNARPQPHEQTLAETKAPVEASVPAGSGQRGRKERARQKRSARRRKSSADAVAVLETPSDEAGESPRMTAAEEAFSVEDLTRLRGRHAALLARIDEEVPDPARAEQLRQTAEALDPDTWVTSEDVKLALERYEQRYRELRDALGPRRRRRAASKPDSDEQGQPA